MQPTPSASQFRAHAVRSARELLLSLAEQWNQFVTWSAPLLLSAPHVLSFSPCLALFTSLCISLSLSLSLPSSLPLPFLCLYLSYLISRRETTLTGCLCLSLFNARWGCIGMRILSRTITLKRFWFKRVRVHVKSKSCFVFIVCDWFSPARVEVPALQTRSI